MDGKNQSECDVMVLKDAEAREVCALIHVCTHIQTCVQGSPFWVAFEKRKNDETPQPRPH